MLRQITPSLCTQSERHGYIMTIIIVIIIIIIIILIIIIIIMIIIIILHLKGLFNTSAESHLRYL